MFNSKAKQNDEQLEEAIAEVLKSLSQYEPESEQYIRISEQLKDLYALREHAKGNRISPDALLQAGTSLLGILAILNFEKANVITTKALSFIMKAK